MEKQHMCPWWLGYALIIPCRKYRHNPDKILSPYVRKGMTVMDFGCAMGYFSIPMAKMTGATGKVYCVDIQEKMLSNLKRRAQKFGVQEIITPLQVGVNYKPSDLKNALDFMLLFAVVHEIPTQSELFRDAFEMMKSGGKILFAEPKGHVCPEAFQHSIELALKAGFVLSDEKPAKKGLAVILLHP